MFQSVSFLFIVVWVLVLAAEGSPTSAPADAADASDASDASDNVVRLHGRVVEAWRAGDAAGALAMLEAYRAVHPALSAALGHDYLIGRCALDAGHNERASAAFRAAAASTPSLGDRALFRLADAEERLGRTAAAAEALSRLLKEHADSLLRDEAAFRLCDLEAARKRFDAALRVLDRLPRTKRRAVSLRRSAVLQAAGRKREAAASCWAILRDEQNDDAAREALRRLTRLEGAPGKASPSEEWLAALTHFFAREFKEAAPLFETHIRRAEPRADPEVFYYAGMSHFRMGDFEQARSWFEKGARAGRPSDWSSRCAFQEARSLAAAGKNREAADLWTKMLTADPKGPYSDDALAEVIKDDIDRGDIEEADRLGRTLGATYASSDRCTPVLIHLMASWCGRGAYDRALAVARSLASEGHAGSGSAEARYWMARMREAAGGAGGTGDAAAAMTEYVALASDRRAPFYRMAARDRLVRMGDAAASAGARHLTEAETAAAAGDLTASRIAATEAAAALPDGASRERALALLRRCYAGLPRYGEIAALDDPSALKRSFPAPRDAEQKRHRAASSVLFFLGAGDEGVRELEASYAPGDRDAAVLCSLAARFQAEGIAPRSMSYAEQVLSRVPYDYEWDLIPRTLKGLVYPMPYRAEIEANAAACGIDPALVFAIVREESRFNPRIRSGAAARGLMQLIPETAAALATEAGIENFEVDRLYDPAVNLKLGTLYLSGLVARFEAAAPAAAAYNAGERAVEKWLGRSGRAHPLLFLGLTEYAETRHYVEKVMSSFWIYQQLLHGRPPDPGSFFELPPPGAGPTPLND